MVSVRCVSHFVATLPPFAGFEDDVLEIRTMAPPVHWAMLFSATFPPAVRRLAARVVSPSALHVSVGHAELAAVATVTQRVEVLRGKVRTSKQSIACTQTHL